MLKKNPPLEQLNISFNRLTAKSIKEIMEALKVNTNIRKLKLNGNSIDSESAKYIGDCLNVNNGIEYITLRDNLIGAGFDYISQSLRKNTKLKYLNLSSNSITDEAFTRFAQHLSYNSSLKIIKLKNNSISRKQANLLIRPTRRVPNRVVIYALKMDMAQALLTTQSDPTSYLYLLGADIMEYLFPYIFTFNPKTRINRTCY